MIVTVDANIPVASHIPFLIEEQGEQIILTSHLAKANLQSQTLPDNDVLVIFTEPHAYVSPKHYEKEQSVPTWNYLAVHAYGKAIIITDEEALLTMMEKMIRQYDVDYLNQWSSLPTKFKTKMLNGIVAFQIKVSNLQAKNKLSQNRTETERNNIIRSFEEGTDTNEMLIAEYMKDCK